VGSLLEVGTGFHPELTGCENIYLNGAILGMKKAEIEQKFDEIVSFAEIEKFIDTPVKHYSSGMYVRLAFAVAAHLEPEILLVDEVLAVGDAAFQKKCLGKMENVAKEGRTVLFVSHNMGAIQQLTSRVILLNRGRVMADTDPIQAVELYLGETSKVEIVTPLKTDRDDFKINSFGIDYDSLENGFNKTITFEVEICLERPLRDVRFGLGIVNSIGARILTSVRTIPGISQGNSRISVFLKEHRLPPGRYSVTVGIDVAGVSVLYKENLVTFEISDLTIDNSFLTQRRDRIGIFVPYEYNIKELKN
jgi:lipopolysaccharide transport system ATP-binding protein